MQLTVFSSSCEVTTYDTLGPLPHILLEAEFHFIAPQGSHVLEMPAARDRDLNGSEKSFPFSLSIISYRSLQVLFCLLFFCHRTQRPVFVLTQLAPQYLPLHFVLNTVERPFLSETNTTHIQSFYSSSNFSR